MSKKHHPPSLRGLWVVSHRGTLLAAFKSRVEMSRWLDSLEDSTYEIKRVQAEITPPKGHHCTGACHI